MHKKILVISDGVNQEEATINAKSVCDDLIDGQNAFDWYVPISKSERFKTSITQTTKINNPEIIKEIHDSLNSGLETFEFWVNESKKEKNQSSKIMDLRIATSPTTFFVFDGTDYCDGSYITDIEEFEKVLKYQREKPQNQIWVSAFDMHY